MAGGFDNIIGQDNIKKILLESIKQNKVNHAYIIEGDEGMGKKTIAYTFAKHLICDENTACGNCDGCVLAEANSHPDIITIKPEEGKKTIGVEGIRALVGDAAIKPYIATKKVIVLSGCDGMTQEAQNALLKVLEEPPDYIVFILLIQNANYLLETVRSRSIKLILQPYTDAQARQGLQQYTDKDLDNYSFILSYAGNNIGKAIMLAQDDGFIALRSLILEKTSLLANSSQLSIYEIIKIFDENKDKAQMILDLMLSVFRDLILIKTGCGNLVQNTDAMNLIKQLERKISMQGLVLIINDILKSKEMLSRNANFSLLVCALINGSWEVVNGRNSGGLF